MKNFAIFQITRVTDATGTKRNFQSVQRSKIGRTIDNGKLCCMYTKEPNLVFMRNVSR